MSQAMTYNRTEQLSRNAIGEEEIQRRIAKIRAGWSMEERARRAELGRVRRELLAVTLGFASRRACA